MNDKVVSKVRQEGVRSDGIRRKSRREEEVDAYYVPEHLVPAGYVVEWKRVSVLGQEDPYYLMKLEADGGWMPATVDMGGLKELLPKGSSSKLIERGGLRLYIRPKHLSDEARQEDLEIAREQVSEKLRQIGVTPEGHAPRRVDILRRSYEQLPVEEK